MKKHEKGPIAKRVSQKLGVRAEFVRSSVKLMYVVAYRLRSYFVLATPHATFHLGLSHARQNVGEHALYTP